MLSSSDDDGAFDAFLASLKPAKKEKYRISSGSLDDFVVDDEHVSFEDASSPRILASQDHRKITFKSKSRVLLGSYITQSDSDGKLNDQSSLSEDKCPKIFHDNVLSATPNSSRLQESKSSKFKTQREDSLTHNDDIQRICRPPFGALKKTLHDQESSDKILPDHVRTEPSQRRIPRSKKCKTNTQMKYTNFTRNRSTASMSNIAKKGAFSTPRLVFSSSDSDDEAISDNKSSDLANCKVLSYDDYSVHSKDCSNQTESPKTDEVNSGLVINSSDEGVSNGPKNATQSDKMSTGRSVENLCSDFGKFEINKRLKDTFDDREKELTMLSSSHLSPINSRRKVSKVLVFSDDSESDDDVICIESDEDKENSEAISTNICDNSSGKASIYNDSVFLTPTIYSKKTLARNTVPSKLRNASFKTPTYTRKDGLPNALPPNCENGAGFKRHREFLTKSMYENFNMTVFEEKLPKDMIVEWDKRLTKTAGITKCSSRTETIRSDGKICVNKTYTAKICLSDKVLDTLYKLRDTLCHEMCHAAVWLIENQNDGHGPFWKGWVRKAMIAHPEMPTIKRCHSYDITYKFEYQCTMCRKVYGRHSKSIKVDKQSCGICTGRLVLLPSKKSDGTPARTRKPNKFAMFVKENYKVTQRSESAGGVTPKHSDIMKALSKQFASLSAKK